MAAASPPSSHRWCITNIGGGNRLGALLPIPGVRTLAPAPAHAGQARPLGVVVPFCWRRRRQGQRRPQVRSRPSFFFWSPCPSVSASSGEFRRKSSRRWLPSWAPSVYCKQIKNNRCCVTPRNKHGQRTKCPGIRTWSSEERALGTLTAFATMKAVKGRERERGAYRERERERERGSEIIYVGEDDPHLAAGFDEWVSSSSAAQVQPPGQVFPERVTSRCVSKLIEAFYVLSELGKHKCSFRTPSPLNKTSPPVGVLDFSTEEGDGRLNPSHTKRYIPRSPQNGRGKRRSDIHATSIATLILGGCCGLMLQAPPPPGDITTHKAAYRKMFQQACWVLIEDISGPNMELAWLLVTSP